MASRHVCNVNDLTTVIMQTLCTYTLLIGHYGCVINDGDVDNNKVSESDGRPQWLSWMRVQLEAMEVGNIPSWRLIMKYFLPSFSPFH